MEIRNITVLKLRALLDSEYGKEVIQHLREKAPPVQSGQPHEIILSAGVNQGWVKAIDALLAIESSEGKKPINPVNP